MANKKKILTSAVALGTAAALTLGGTFAWQSISQGAVNEASDVINPGGRLHNDQHWVSDLENDTNIYVENFTEAGKGEDIYARVRLSEYMEVVMNYGTEAEVVDVVAGLKTPKDGVEGLTEDSATQRDKFDYAYAVHYFGEENKTDDFFTWTEGEADADRPWFIPTFNKNKDSLAADLNGEYADTLGGISNRGESQYDYVEITEDTEDVTASAIYDADSDKDDELKTLTYAELKEVYEEGEDSTNETVTNAINNKDIMLVEETHAATQVGETRGLIALSDWLELNEDTDNYWVYDTDGWVYWSSPIKPGETTGLLLDGFKLNGVMDDTWYYAIDVQAQFVTADDVGRDDGTGFYDTENGTAPTENAEKLLEKIGVEFGKSDTTAPTFVSAEHPEGDNMSQAWNMTICDLNDGDFPLTLKGYYLDGKDAQISGDPYFTARITVEESEVSVNVTCAGNAPDFDTRYYTHTYDADAGTLTLECHWATGDMGRWAALTVTDASGNTGGLSGSIWVADGVGCFTAGTQVSGPDGLVSIENIEEGDQVYSLDLASGEKTAVTVLKVHDQWVNDEFYHITVGGETITATPEHLFYVGDEWVEACELSVGDALVSLCGAEDTTITKISYEKMDAPITVYNLTVDGDHNFLITGDELVVHNVSK